MPVYCRITIIIFHILNFHSYCSECKHMGYWWIHSVTLSHLNSANLGSAAPLLHPESDCCTQSFPRPLHRHLNLCSVEGSFRWLQRKHPKLRRTPTHWVGNLRYQQQSHQHDPKREQKNHKSLPSSHCFAIYSVETRPLCHLLLQKEQLKPGGWWSTCTIPCHLNHPQVRLRPFVRTNPLSILEPQLEYNRDYTSLGRWGQEPNEHTIYPFSISHLPSASKVNKTKLARAKLRAFSAHLISISVAAWVDVDDTDHSHQEWAQWEK